jgi:hypothetical protein
MANIAKNAILRAKIEGVITDLMVKTTADQVYVNDTTTLAAHLATLAASADVQALQQAVNALGELSKKDKVSYADLETALASLIDGKAEASALTEEIARAKAAEEAAAAAAAAAQAAADKAQGEVDAVEGRVDAVEGRMDVAEGKLTKLIGDDADKSIRAIANEELAAQLIGENAKESLNELQEIAAWIQSHPDDASAMNEAIVALQNKVNTGDKTVSAYVADAIAALSIGDYAKAADLTALAGRVETAEGKITALEGNFNGLGALAAKDVVAEADLDADLKAKVNAAAEGNHSHSNKGVLDGITAEKVAAWDAAEGNAKTHATNLNTAMDTRMQAVEALKHTHDNKTVLDGITAANVASWNGKAKVYGANETVDLAEGEIFIQLI